MASNSQEYGYEDERFQNVVNPNFHCSICLNVLKSPKMCKNNQHVFCSLCITRHLANSPTCPECVEELTIQTLNQAPRVLMNCLSELNIKCDYYSRGCREYTQLGNLNTHILDCGFRPVRCSNYECVVVVNKRDIIYHEKEVCEFRKHKCHNCGEIRKDIDELKQNQAKLTEDVVELKQNQVELMENQAKLAEDVAEVKEGQAQLKQNQAEMKEQLNQLPVQLNEVKDMLVAVLNTLHNEEETIQPPLHVKSAKKQDVVITGGRNVPFQTSSSAELFNWEKGAWVQLPPMKEPRSSASSFVYENHVVVAGGDTDRDSTDSMEMMNTDKEPLQWITFPAKLPAKLRGHTAVVYENRLIVIGGYKWTEDKHSNAIYEVRLIPPYSTKLLRRMPQPRDCHGTELVNNKIFILGGKTSFVSNDAIDSVIVYDVVKNECKEMRPLPYAVCGMATVSWRNKVVLIGGCDKNGQILNDVIMYDIESGESESLPSIKYKRWCCSAVITEDVTEDVMVVIGGVNDDQGYLNSVECFSFSSNSWKEFPAMMEARQYPTAVVKPISH